MLALLKGPLTRPGQVRPGGGGRARAWMELWVIPQEAPLTFNFFMESPEGRSS